MDSPIEQALENARPYNPDGPSDQFAVYSTHAPNFKTVAEWGLQLPHGLVRNGRLNRSFELKPQNVKLDIDIGKIKADPATKDKFGRRLAAIAATVCTEIAGETVGSATPKAIALVESLVPADVFYILLTRAAQKNRGNVPIPELSGECPHCREAVNVKSAPFDRVLVDVIEWGEGLAHPTAALKLDTPLSSGAKTVEAIAVQPCRWGGSLGSAKSQDEANNGALLQHWVRLGSVVGCKMTDGEIRKGALTEDALLSLSSWDAEGLYEAAIATWGGLQFIVEVEHDCGGGIALPFAWRSMLSG